MKTIIITPFLNEEAVIGDLIKSVISQQLKPAKWVLVDDGSSDKSIQIIQELAKDYNWISVLQLDHKTKKRSIGAKIINAFNSGLGTVSMDDYDIIMKLDGEKSEALGTI